MKTAIQQVPLKSQVDNLKQGDKLYTVEYVSENDKPYFKNNEFEFVQYLKKGTHIENLEEHENSILAELKNGNVTVKTDISMGFWRKKKDAARAFVEFTEILFESAKSIYEKKYEEYVSRLGTTS